MRNLHMTGKCTAMAIADSLLPLSLTSVVQSFTYICFYVIFYRFVDSIFVLNDTTLLYKIIHI